MDERTFLADPAVLVRLGPAAAEAEAATARPAGGVGPSAGPLGSHVARLLLLELLDEIRELQVAVGTEASMATGAYVRVSLGSQLARLGSLEQCLRSVLLEDALAQAIGGVPSPFPRSRRVAARNMGVLPPEDLEGGRVPGTPLDPESVPGSPEGTARESGRAGRGRDSRSRGSRRLGVTRFSGATFLGIFHSLDYSGPQN